MRKSFVLLMTMFISGSVFANGAMTTTPSEKLAPVNVSYVQSSAYSEVRPVDMKKGVYQLVINDVSPYVSYFSDRPNRIVGQLPMSAFLKQWGQGEHSFSLDAPNGILSGVQRTATGKHVPMNVVMVLSQPVYQASKQTMTYQVQILKDAPKSSDGSIMLHNATLIIDNACLTCIG